MLLQLRMLLEALCAVAAAVQPLLRVTEHVYFEVSPSGTGLPTLLTSESFLPGVDQLVLLQSSFSPELFPTHFAAERPLPGVGEEVLPEGA